VGFLPDFLESHREAASNFLMPFSYEDESGFHYGEKRADEGTLAP
jgi:hypothetical protein